MDTNFRSRIRRSKRGVRCTFDSSAGHRRGFRYLAIQIPEPGVEGDLLATATVCLGPSAGESGRGPAGILIRFPVAWYAQHRPAAATNTVRSLASYRAREPLIWDFVTLLLQPGHSRTLIESAAVALVCCVLQAEADLGPSGWGRRARRGSQTAPASIN